MSTIGITSFNVFSNAVVQSILAEFLSERDAIKPGHPTKDLIRAVNHVCCEKTSVSTHRSLVVVLRK